MAFNRATLVAMLIPLFLALIILGVAFFQCCKARGKPLFQVIFLSANIWFLSFGIILTTWAAFYGSAGYFLAPFSLYMGIMIHKAAASGNISESSVASNVSNYVLGLRVVGVLMLANAGVTFWHAAVIYQYYPLSAAYFGCDISTYEATCVSQLTYILLGVAAGTSNFMIFVSGMHLSMILPDAVRNGDGVKIKDVVPADRV